MDNMKFETDIVFRTTETGLELVTELTSESMSYWDLENLKEMKSSLRNILNNEIPERISIEAEILYLQNEIKKHLSGKP